MSPVRSIARALAAAALLVGLTGCISLLPKATPAQLYRFGAAEASQPAQPGAGAVALGDIDFDSAAATDKILTYTGQQAAYIEGSRWVVPAPKMFEEALEAAFQNAQGAPRLVAIGGPVRAPLELDLSVQSFETRYDQGDDAAPRVVVTLKAMLIRTADRSLVGEQRFTADKRAGDNRVGAIVEAYQEAVREVLAKLVDWSMATAA